jgi:hypothetical protein
MHEQYVQRFKAYKNVCWKKNTQANKLKHNKQTNNKT